MKFVETLSIQHRALATYHVIIILANLLLLLIQELISRYLRKKKNRRGRRKSTYIVDLNYITLRRTFPI